MTDYTLRAARPEDLNFILSTWLRNYRFSSPFAKNITNTVYYKWHEKLVKAILTRPSTWVTVACDPTDTNVVYGYIVAETQDVNVLHYIYVKKPFRGFGIGKALMDANTVNEYTHAVYDLQWALDKYPGLTYCPYRV